MLAVTLGALAVTTLGAFVIRWGIACRDGKARQQRWLGYRTPRTLTDHDAWITAHRAAGPFIIAGGCGALVASVVAVVLGLIGYQTLAGAALGSSVIWVFACLIAGGFPAMRAVRKAHP